MIAEVVSLKGLWSTLFMTCLVFGFAPGAILRLAVLMFPSGNDRRRELIAELYVVPRWERPVWVAQQLEVTLFEGIAERLQRRKAARAPKEESLEQLLERWDETDKRSSLLDLRPHVSIASAEEVERFRMRKARQDSVDIASATIINFEEEVGP